MLHLLFSDKTVKTSNLSAMRVFLLSWLKQFKLFLLLILPLLFIMLGAYSLPAQAKPNILLLIGDDVGYVYHGFMQPFVTLEELEANGIDPNTPFDELTPTLDTLAEEGLVVPIAHTTSPRCRPSFTTIFSGRYAIDMDVKDRFADPAS